MKRYAFLLLSFLAAVPASASTIEFKGYSALPQSLYLKGSTIDMMLEYTNGQCVGYDIRTGGVVNDLVTGSYADSGVGYSARLKNLVVIDPPTGAYNLYIVGKSPSFYYIDVNMNLNDEQNRSAVCGFIDGDELQRAEIQFSSGTPTGKPLIQKRVDLYYLKREVSLAQKMNLMDKKLGDQLSGFLSAAEAAFAAGDFPGAIMAFNDFLDLVDQERSHYEIKTDKDVRLWFMDYFAATPESIQRVLAQKDLYFRYVENIRDEKKMDWFKAQLFDLLSSDTEILVSTLKPSTH